MGIIADVTAPWVIGWIIGVVIVLLVVALLLLMIRGVSRAATKAGAIVDALKASQENTEGLWEVDTTNRTVGRITKAATQAREFLAERADA